MNLGPDEHAPYGYKPNGRPYRTSPEHRLLSKLYRDCMRDLGRCINGGSHGPAVPGRDKCQQCINVHDKRGKSDGKHHRV
jgi:hypothetical protein